MKVCFCAAPSRLWVVLTFAVFLLGPSLAHAVDWRAEGEGREEMEARLPPFPREENLLPFPVSALTENRFFIDGESISVGSDGVVRYTLVVTSVAGARNITYEGLRCSVAERRIYAFGRADSTWSRARSSQWAGFHGVAVNRHHAVLFQEYFCVNGSAVRHADEARSALRSGGRSSVQQW